jgi:hypothetical protein
MSASIAPPIMRPNASCSCCKKKKNKKIKKKKKIKKGIKIKNKKNASHYLS